MTLVIRTINILAVPAAGEMQRDTPAATAGLLWELLGV